MVHYTCFGGLVGLMTLVGLYFGDFAMLRRLCYASLLVDVLEDIATLGGLLYSWRLAIFGGDLWLMSWRVWCLSLEACLP